MSYDFTSALNAAMNVVNQQSRSNDNKVYPYPLFYPPKGQTITVKLLFNPASNQIIRLINRHGKVPCYRTYHTECPICKIQEQVISTTGQDPFIKEGAKCKARGLAFVQLISSTVAVENIGGTKINIGDIALLMYPWSVYTQLNACISAVGQTPSGMERAFCSATDGLFVQISVDNDYKYTTTPVPYMTFSSGMTDEQFMKMLDEMPSLNEQVIPDTITQEVDAQVKEYVNSIYSKYISPRIPNQTPQVAPANLSDSALTISVNPNPTPIYQTTQQIQIPTIPAANGKPDCFGHHSQGSPQCICCPDEVLCMSKAPFEV